MLMTSSVSITVAVMVIRAARWFMGGRRQEGQKGPLRPFSRHIVPVGQALRPKGPK